MQDPEFNPQQSLRLIQSMIDKTKADISENRFYFLLWGWVALTGIVGQFVLKVIFRYERHYLIWLVTFIGVIVSIVYSHRQQNQQRAKTYVGDNMNFLWTGMGISFFILSVLFFRLGWQNCYPFFILFYGLGTFVSGRILQFQPLVIGGIFNWALAAASVFFTFDYQMLFAAAAILTSYIIPGYLLKPQNSSRYAGA